MCRKRTARLLLSLLAVAALLALGLAAVAYWVAGPSATCRGAVEGPARPGTTNRVVRSGGMERCYLLYVPASYDPSQPAPVVLSLHGFASLPQGQHHLARWEKVADREGFWVVYPQGTGFPLRWNAFPALSPSPVDDVQFISDLLADLASIAAVDPARVYASGMSNGGSMAHRLACDLSDTIAAAGVVAGPAVNPPDDCMPSRPVPMMAFYGTADPLVPYEGGGRFYGVLARRQALSPDQADSEPTFLPAEQWIANWAERNGCDPTPESIAPHGDASGQRYVDCRAGSDVIFYTIDGGGHTWPGGSNISLGKTSSDIDASQTMWEFFKDHPLAGSAE